MAERPRSEPARLLVLGAGPAQLGLLEAAAARGPHVIAADRDPLAPGFGLVDERAVISSEDEQGIERLARARDVDGIVSPGADWPVGIAARVAERLGLPHPIDGATAVLATTKTRQRERFAAAGVPQPRTSSRRATRRSRSPASSRRPTGRASAASRSSATRAGLAAAVAAAAAESRGGGVARRGADRRPGADGERGLGRRVFVPLTVTDRLLAEPPAFGVALAHAWPSEHPTDARRRGGRGRRRGARDRERPDLHPDPARCRRAAVRDRGRSTARRRPRCRALPRRGRRRPGRPRRLVRARRARSCADKWLRASSAAASAGRALSSSSRPRACCARRRASRRPRRVEGVEWVRTYRRPGWRFGPLRRGADRAGAVLATGATATRRSPGLVVRRRPYASWSMRTRA